MQGHLYNSVWGKDICVLIELINCAPPGRVAYYLPDPAYPSSTVDGVILADINMLLISEGHEFAKSIR